MIEIYDEKDVEKFAQKLLDTIIGKMIEKFTKDFHEEFYKNMQSYIYEHYDNGNTLIKQKVINSIANDFSSDPLKYDFISLRERLWGEHKDTITDENVKKLIKENLYLTERLKNYDNQWGH